MLDGFALTIRRMDGLMWAGCSGRSTRFRSPTAHSADIRAARELIGSDTVLTRTDWADESVDLTRVRSSRHSEYA
ncbi:hypothetical protein GCM10027088_40870 [Nocardia goodfellowii]|uniref:DUF1508 domain-containing protein n=1 Tax=Nocardia goodfellowii TaxID=882446 RepID=A0ABS4QK29_9NOCA|nr:hypothetical protein [Nocardia goodfellowii]